MKFIIYLSFIFFISEFLLMLIKRSKKSTSKHRKDEGSLILLWITITLCFTFGFMLAHHSAWNYINSIVAGFGIVLILLGLVIRWSAIIQLKKAFTVDVAIGTEQSLKTNGMYKSTRHPSYLGLLVIMFGFALCMNSILSFFVIIAPMFLVVWYRISVEEKLLVEAFGAQYVEYKKGTKKLIPLVI